MVGWYGVVIPINIIIWLVARKRPCKKNYTDLCQ